MMKKKGLKFGVKKKNDLDAFIEDEFNKINKQDGDNSNQKNQDNNVGQDDNYNAGGAARSGAQSIVGGNNSNEKEKKPTAASKPIFKFKKSQIKKSEEPNPPQGNFQAQQNLEESESLPTQSIKPNDNDHQNPSTQSKSNVSSIPFGMPKAMKDGSKPNIPTKIKPMKVQKKKFQMAAPDEKQSGIYDIKPQKEELVESLMDNEENNRSNNQNKVQKAQQLVQPNQVGPKVMINKVKKNLEESKIEGKRPPSKQGKQNNKKQEDSDDDYVDDNYDNDFEDEQQQQENEEDQLEKLRKAMLKEKTRAMKYQEKKQTGNVQQHSRHTNNNLAGPQFNLNSSQHNEHEPTQMKNLEGFAQGKGLIIGERVDHVAANQQVVRAEELRDLVDLSQEEFFNMFEMIPQTPQDVYFSKLTAGTLKTAIVSSSDDYIDKDVQTEDLGEEHKFNQAPEDIMTNYNNNKNYQRKQQGENEALNLERLMARAGPTIEQVLEENQQLLMIDNRQQAQKRNSVEQKSNLKFPNEILVLFSQKNQLAKLLRISAIHMFESSPQSKCAVSYVLEKPNGDEVYLILVYSVLINQVLRVFRSESEVTQMCTPADDTVLIAGTIVGSLNIFDLKNLGNGRYRLDELNYEALLQYELEQKQEQEMGETNQANLLQQLKNKYSIYYHTFTTDGLPNYSHFSPIKKLQFVSKYGGGAAQIGAIDELLTISTWSVIEIQQHIAEKMNEFDLNLSIGGRYKLLENFQENLMYTPEVLGHGDDIRDISSSLDLEFDSNDPNIFYFSCSTGLFKFNRRISSSPCKLDTQNLSAPTCISLSDKGYLLVSFASGSIAMFHNDYSAPITIWYDVCQYPITQIKWCLLYFQDDGQKNNSSPQKKHKGEVETLENVKFATRLCEFFVIDQGENFVIWNLQKNIHKPTHTIKFNEKHQSDPNYKNYKISMTCPDQTFFTAFALKDYSVNMYLMNFKKGSQITKDRLQQENKKSLNILNTLPLNDTSSLLPIDEL